MANGLTPEFFFENEPILISQENKAAHKIIELLASEQPDMYEVAEKMVELTNSLSDACFFNEDTLGIRDYNDLAGKWLKGDQTYVPNNFRNFLLEVEAAHEAFRHIEMQESILYNVPMISIEGDAVNSNLIIIFNMDSARDPLTEKIDSQVNIYFVNPPLPL
ncbi:hypothetical protein KAZ57_01185 [Patescibacteria group bacterium]|nr:hypothetical protein [Patescibacteria group bacterium]